MFLLCGSDDRPEVVSGIANIYLKLREAKVPAELHLYDRVGHGFGLRLEIPDRRQPGFRHLSTGCECPDFHHGVRDDSKAFAPSCRSS
jgi:acetyl esterase/lipase